MVRLTEDQARGLLQLVRDSGVDVSFIGSNAHEALTVLQEQLDAPNHSSDLIDQMAGLLKESGARSIISSEMLRRLRKAILTPRELATVDAVRANHCMKCGTQIHVGELCSVQGVGEVCCYFCAAPNVLTCRGCHHVLALSTGVGRVIQKMVKECSHCKAAEEAGVGEVAPLTPAAPFIEQPIAAYPATARPQRVTIGDTQLHYLIEVPPTPRFEILNHRLWTTEEDGR